MSHNEDCNILESILGYPYFGKLPYLMVGRRGVCSLSIRHRDIYLVLGLGSSELTGSLRSETI